MKTSTYYEYKDICSLLNLLPLSRKEYRATYEEQSWGQQYGILTNNNSIDIYSLTHDGGYKTVSAFPRDLESPCIKCLASKLSLLDGMYDHLSRESIECFARYAGLVSVFAEHHNIPFSYTEIFSDQPWSVVYPTPGCSFCKKNKIFNWNQARHRISEKRRGSRTFSDNTSGIRRLNPQEFIKTNRHVIGYGAIVPNPGLEEKYGVFLTNSHIYTGRNLSELETAGGKGYSEEQSVASWLGEGLERYYLNYLSGSSRYISENSVRVSSLDA